MLLAGTISLVNVGTVCYSQTLKLIPEWENPKSLVLVYPKSLPEVKIRSDRELLIGFYDSLLSSLYTNCPLLKIKLIIQPSDAQNHLLKEKLVVLNKNVELIPINLNDVWVRDFAPFIVRHPDERVSLVKATYQPEKYLPIEESELDNKAGAILSNPLQLPLSTIDLNLDGGNLIHNGKGVAIATRRLIEDNRDKSEIEIREVLRDKLGIELLILVKEDPLDKTGHIDGMVRFINDRTLVISTYSEDYPEDKKFMASIADSIRAKLDSSYKILRMNSAIPSSYKGKEGMYTAWGNYINFLQVGDKIFIPQYGQKEHDDAAISILKNNLNSVEVIQVNYDINKLANLGGLLRCISWSHY